MSVDPQIDELLRQLSEDDAKILEWEISRELEGRRLEFYRPNRKQEMFHRLGKHYRERMLSAGNQLGKTLSAGAEFAMHMTGRYPDNWEGHTFDKRIVSWAAGVSTDALRDGVQRILFGRMDSKESPAWGSGMIPRDALPHKPMWRQGSNLVIDSAVVRYGGGGDVQADYSMVTLKSYDQGRQKFQADTLNLVWLDEEPPYEIYSECKTRTNATLGPIMLTFTPLMGMTETVKTFWIDRMPGTTMVNMTIDDVDHYTPEQKAAIIASYKPHERAARVRGEPALGEGRVFPIDEESIKVAPFKIPDHWLHIIGIDFGWDHPTAAAWLVYDPDTDILYLIATYRERERTPLQNATAIKAWGDWIPVAWPHDGHRKDKTEKGIEYAQVYRDYGLNMLESHATHFSDEGEGKGGYAKEVGVGDMYDRMLSGRFKVFSYLNTWFEEFRLYHRKDGQIVSMMDDLLDATRHACMMKRFAVRKPRMKRDSGRTGSWRTV